MGEGNGSEEKHFKNMNEKKYLRQQYLKNKRIVTNRAEGLVLAREWVKTAKGPDIEVKGKPRAACVRRP